MKKISNKALCLLMIFVMLLPAFSFIATAEESSSVAFKDVNVMEDLASLKLNGESFDPSDYPANPLGKVDVISFVEWCYSYDQNKMENYDLFVYIYNPRKLALSSSDRHYIEMAVEFDANGNAVSYNKYKLEYCNRSVGDYDKLFYKFRVVDRRINGKTIAESVSKNKRIYEISSIELCEFGASSATDHSINNNKSYRYSFSGYAEGFGMDPSADSTLSCKLEDGMETISLELHSTYYRTTAPYIADNHYVQISTVYFSVPEKYFETYGNLQKIHCQWWEYKTKMACVTSNLDFYRALLPYVGTYVDNYNADIPVGMGVFVYEDHYSTVGLESTWLQHYSWSYNLNLNHKYDSPTALIRWADVNDNGNVNMMPYAFYSPVESVAGVFDFLFDMPPAGDVSRNEVAEWIYNYSNDLGNGYIDCNGRPISKDLFEDCVDEGRIIGFNEHTVDFGDTFELKGYEGNRSWISKLWQLGFGDEYSTVDPIYEVKASDIEYPDDEFAEKFFFNENDVADFKTYFKTESKKNNRVILFRFANTDYYASPVRTNMGDPFTYDTYISQQTVFLDFDVIDLTFRREGEDFVIPVVASPIDIIGGFESKMEPEFKWWAIILILVAIIIFILLLPVFRVLVDIIIAPFKLLFNSLKSSKKSE